MAVYTSVADLIGNTPLVELVNYEKNHNLQAKLIAKVEFFNPAGSAKDRVAKAMLETAEREGKLNSETVLIEPTSGNTGIALAALAAARGNRSIIVMPDTMSQEIPNSLIAGQFTNPANPAAHRATTGPEIWQATDGAIDILVAGVGTGGTLSGAGSYLKEQNPQIEVIAVEPADSPVLSEGRSGAHGIQGIGAGFVPDTLDISVYDEVVTTTTQEAFEAARELAAKEGLLVGISSGAAVAAAARVAQRAENKDKTIVVVLPDTGERYLSSALFMPETETE